MNTEVTASVGQPTPIPERPTLYMALYSDGRNYGHRLT